MILIKLLFAIVENIQPVVYCNSPLGQVMMQYCCTEKVNTNSPFYWGGLTLIPAWISSHMLRKVWDEIIYPFLNFNGATVEVLEWISNFIPHIIMDAITYPCLGLKLNHVSKRGHSSVCLCDAYYHELGVLNKGVVTTYTLAVSACMLQVSFQPTNWNQNSYVKIVTMCIGEVDYYSTFSFHCNKHMMTYICVSERHNVVPACSMPSHCIDKCLPIVKGNKSLKDKVKWKQIQNMKDLTKKLSKNDVENGW